MVINSNYRQDLLMSTLTDFFSKKSSFNMMYPIITGESKLSLRIIDWFVTNYAKKHNVMYCVQHIEDNELVKKQFIVHMNYKSQLKAYSKKQFDPFCRRDRINFYYDKDNSITTTVGQLNFFRWAIQNNILDYIEDNIENIEKDMNISVKHLYNKNKEAEKTRRKRQQLSVSATRTVSKHYVSMTVDFGSNEKL